jgi:hypothetical protein
MKQAENPEIVHALGSNPTPTPHSPTGGGSPRSPRANKHTTYAQKKQYGQRGDPSKVNESDLVSDGNSVPTMDMKKKKVKKGGK